MSVTILSIFMLWSIVLVVVNHFVSYTYRVYFIGYKSYLTLTLTTLKIEENLSRETQEFPFHLKHIKENYCLFKRYMC